MLMYEKELQELFEELVPASGAADTVAGEIVRAVNRLGYRWINDGDKINQEYGKQTCNGAARFLMKNAGWDTKRALQRFFDTPYDFENDKFYECALNEVITCVYIFLTEYPELKTEENDDDYQTYSCRCDFEYEEEEDY